jgi:hypothetical protein
MSPVARLAVIGPGFFLSRRVMKDQDQDKDTHQCPDDLLAC